MIKMNWEAARHPQQTLRSSEGLWQEGHCLAAMHLLESLLKPLCFYSVFMSLPRFVALFDEFDCEHDDRERWSWIYFACHA